MRYDKNKYMELLIMPLPHLGKWALTFLAVPLPPQLRKALLLLD